MRSLFRFAFGLCRQQMVAKKIAFVRHCLQLIAHKSHEAMIRAG